MTDYTPGDTAAIAAHPDRNEGRNYELVVIERAYDNEGVPSADVLTLGPNPRRLTGLPLFDSRDELEDAALEHAPNLEKAQGENHPLGPRDPSTGRRRPVEFVDLVDWHNGVFPIDDVDQVDDDEPARPVRPAKKAAKKAPAKAAADAGN